MNYFSIVNLPVNGVKDMITQIVYPYSGPSDRLAAEVAAKAAQDTVKASLGLPESAGLAEWQAAYLASQV